MNANQGVSGSVLVIFSIHRMVRLPYCASLCVQFVRKGVIKHSAYEHGANCNAGAPVVGKRICRVERLRNVWRVMLLLRHPIVRACPVVAPARPALRLARRILANICWSEKSTSSGRRGGVEFPK